VTVAAVYLRQSLDRTGEAVAVARQREDCTALCRKKGWQPVEFVDNDTSASTGKKRPRYEQMLAAIEAGEVGAVVAWDLDRLHRRPVELESFIDLADRHRLALATVSGDVDLSTAQGRLVARLKGSVARHEVEQKSARQVRAMRQIAESGKPQWRRAFGYLDTLDGPVPDPATAPLVVEAYRLILAGGSLGAVCKLFNNARAVGLNGKPWTPSTVSLFLRAPRNAGLRAYRGEIIGTGTWAPLVDEQLWRSVQSVLDDPNRRKPGRKSVRKHLLTGVMACGRDGCDGKLTGLWNMQLTGGKSGRPPKGQAKETHPGQVAHRIVYSCKGCHRCSIRAELVEPMLLELVAGRLAMPDAVHLLKAEQADPAEAERLRAERLTLLARLDTAADDYADGVLDGRGYARVRDRIQGQLAELDRAEADAERLRVFDGIPLGTPEAVDAIAGLADDEPDRYRAILDVLVAVTVLPVGKLGNVFNPERVQVVWR
jgi:DNA invertase Pin-like site-specific DNA recombinase